MTVLRITEIPAIYRKYMITEVCRNFSFSASHFLGL